MISAKIIADSINTQGQRLTTFVLVFPRIVLAEFNTHRMISRNSASSRAIPFHKMLESVQKNPFIPTKWMKEHPGMQGTEFFTDKDLATDGGREDGTWATMPEVLKDSWLDARDGAVEAAKVLSNNGLTKQFCNRLLEPFMWHTVIATGTEWENFFALRAHEAAEIHIQELAHRMLEAYNESAPKPLQPGEWHIPFGDKFDEGRIIACAEKFGYITDGSGLLDLETEEMFKVKIATARCARISYNNFDGKDDYEADIKLHDRLAASGHWSPFEHCARAMSDWDFSAYKGNTVKHVNPDGSGKWSTEQGWCGNFRGFVQYRKLFNNENRTDDRVAKKSQATANS